MTNVSFDLVDILRAIQKRKVFVLIITVAAMLLASGLLLVKKDKYKGTARFFVNNPLYGDRSTLFRSMDTRYVDYFGGDDDVDKMMAFANSDTVRGRIIRNCQFQEVYKQDINDPKGYAYLMSIFNKNFSIKRTEYKDMEVSYIGYDPVVAANVANMAVVVLGQTYQNYYNNIKNSIYVSIEGKVKELDSAINLLTDSLAGMRDRSGIYSLISPARQNVVSGDMKGGGKGYGRAIEEIQNVESVKDQLVADKAHYISAMNEFSATTNHSMEFVKLITRALPATSPSGPGLMIVLIASGLLGFFFSTLYVLMMAYFRKLNAVER